MATVANKNGKLVYNAGGTHGKHGAPAMNTLTTAKAETYQLLLSDGSKVWLNAGSSIRFPVSFTEKVRRVEITGEVYFEVAHNEKKPFIVKAGETEIQVLGTTFNVNSYADEGAIKTTLLTGKVKIVNEEKQAAILKPGEQALVSQASHPIPVQTVNVDQVVAWRFGLFQFDRDDIKTVMRQIARWYDVEVSYEGQIPKIEFWGKISRDLNAAEMCKVLERYGVHFRIEGKKIIVTP
jgi:transmembrane sensor